MVKMKKAICLLAAFSMTASLFAGCGGKNEPQKPAASAAPAPTAAATAKAAEPAKEVKLTFVNWGSVEDATKPAFAAMIQDFEKKNPGVKVESVGYPFNNMKDQLLILNAGGNPPDLSQANVTWVAGLNAANALAAMEDVLDKALLDDFYPGSMTGTTINGKKMSAPWNVAPILMFYNKVLMQKAGISAPPKTWAEMVDQSRKIAKLGKDEKGNKIYGISIASKKMFNAGYFFLPNMWQNGGEFVDEKGNVVLNSPGTIAAFKETQALMKEEVMPAGLEIKETRNLFAQGQLGFHFDVASIMAVFEKGSPKGKEFAKDYGAMRIPGMKDPNGFSFSSDHHFVVFKASKNQKVSSKFIDYLSGPEGMKIYIDNGTTVLPARKATEGLEFYKKADDKLKPFLEAIPTIRSLPAQNVEFVKACEEIADAIQRVGLNNEDPAKIVPELEKKIKTLYKQ